MKALKIIGLGVGIWGLGLIWPELNQLISARIMAGLGAGLATITLVYDLWRWHHKHRSTPGSDQPMQTIPPIAMARR